MPRPNQLKGNRPLSQWHKSKSALTDEGIVLFPRSRLERVGGGDRCARETASSKLFFP